MLDTVRGGMVDAALRCLCPGGRAIVVGFASGHIPALKDYVLLKDISMINSSEENALKRRRSYLHHLIGDFFGKAADGEFSPLSRPTIRFRNFRIPRS